MLIGIRLIEKLPPELDCPWSALVKINGLNVHEEPKNIKNSESERREQSFYN